MIIPHSKNGLLESPPLGVSQKQGKFLIGSQFLNPCNVLTTEFVAF